MAREHGRPLASCLQTESGESRNQPPSHVPIWVHWSEAWFRGNENFRLRDIHRRGPAASKSLAKREVSLQNGELLFLRSNVKVEPLIDRWYAWPHLVPPATAARNVTERHMKIMESYIEFPQMHAQATKDPKMRGGPFIDYAGKRVDEIKELCLKTKEERAQLFQLSAALKEVDDLLQEHAKGYSLTPLYPKIPQLLRGFVELGYDLSNHPTWRLLEPLLYRSQYYERAAQSLTLSLITGDDRPFVLSTPRLPGPDCLDLRIAFDDERVDKLFRLKCEPKPWTDIKETFEIPDHADALAKSFFTPLPPPAYSPYLGTGARWRYFGHACILLETEGCTLFFDPVISYTYESAISRYTYLDLPDKIDYVFISHNHQDHILFETLMQIRRKAKAIIVPRNGSGQLFDPSVRLILENSGFSSVIELAEMQSIPIPNGEITAIPFLGEHADLAVSTKLAYVVRIGNHKLLFAADSCNIEPHLYERIHQAIGDIDTLFLGMECDGAPLSWLYGPLLPRRLDHEMDQSRRLCGSNFAQAINIVEELRCREAYVYAMGQEPWLNYIMSIKYTAESRPIIESDKLLSECAKRGICAERLFGEKEIVLNV